MKALDYEVAKDLFDCSDDELENIGAKRIIVDAYPGYPCRVSLKDAQIGEEVVAFSYCHHDVFSPYNAQGPIFVRKNIEKANLPINTLPKMIGHRLLSVRGYNAIGLMIEADVIEGTQLAETIQGFFNNNEVDYIHIHNAKPGCYNFAVIRA
ncbi:MAG: DUF1203 domain-containing protein [Alphaproteobacteria bacterium]